MKITAQIKPNSKVAKIKQIDATKWIINTKAPAIENRANLEACALIAAELNLPKSAVRLKLGAKSRTKIFEINQ